MRIHLGQRVMLVLAAVALPCPAYANEAQHVLGALAPIATIVLVAAAGIGGLAWLLGRSRAQHRREAERQRQEADDWTPGQ